jgi:MFS family permease
MRIYFYIFLGIHSFLIGLFPFYIPVYLYANGFSVERICLFIALTGVGFCFFLYFWERATQHITFSYLVVFSYISEFILLSLFLIEKNLVFLVTAAFVNGIFNCNFWILQRLLFLEMINPQNTGKKFGNFQIFVLVILKSAIFLGGILLESSGFLSLYLVSLGIVLLSSAFFLKTKIKVEFRNEWRNTQPLKFVKVLSFEDQFRSKWIFAVDGIFLYLESYFWIITLFLIVRESFSRLGLLVILLTVLFGFLFILIKNKIDTISVNTFYISAVVLYSLSWVLRAGISEIKHKIFLLVLLAVITFCTSIFRLAFNKRFFDIAQHSTPHEYIFLKSYYSQGFLVFFTIIPLFLSLNNGGTLEQLSSIYLGAAVLSMIYLLYRANLQGEK